MHTVIRYPLVGICIGMAVLIGACSPPGHQTASPSPTGGDPGAAKAVAKTVTPAAPARSETVFAEPRPGLVVHAVDGMHVAHDFNRSYLALDAWKLSAGPDSVGTPLVALVLEGSNALTAAELRIGRSDHPAAIKDCLTASAEATAATDLVDIGGVPFTHFASSDAAMSHYLQAQCYRVVRQGACYAIDLIVVGTRPEVYDPPRTPPFSTAQAQQQLADALQAVSWVE